MKDLKKMKTWMTRAVVVLLLASGAAIAQDNELGQAPDFGKYDVAAVDDGHDVEITAIVENEVGMRCDSCNTTQSLIQAAASRLPTARRTNVYAINARLGIVVGVYLNYLAPGEQDVRMFTVDPIITQWVADVGRVYRENGNSLRLRLVARADGSMYWVRANGTREEIKDPDPRLDSGFSPMLDGNGVNDAPPNSAPIDLRGYDFPPNFSTMYPSFPPTSYDFAFDPTPSVRPFVRDETANIQYGTATGVINGTVSTEASGGLTTPVASVTGGVTVTNNLTSSINVYVPMKDGGFALVSYDKKTGLITLLQLEDGQGNNLPTNHPDPMTYLRGAHFRFGDSGQGHASIGSFRDWALDNGIPIMGDTPWYYGSGSRVCILDPATGQRVMCTKED